MTPEPSCRICYAPMKASFVAREMMFGTRETFTYDECDRCGCVQIRSSPADSVRYASDRYYSLQLPAGRGTAWTLARRIRNGLLYGNPFGIGRVFASVLPMFPVETLEWFSHTRTHRESRVLDVGSGAGLLVRDLGDVGFTSVLGIDPFIERSIQYRPGVRVERATIEDTTGEFDLVMFHHSLEHMPDQLTALGRACELTAPDGWCLVRVPLASSHAWRHYRENWVQLDAPRHHFLHSVQSLAQVASEAGLRLDRVTYDSTGMQFWGSEAYRRDVPLSEARSLFSRRQIREFDRRARALNASGDGDQACFYFRRISVDRPVRGR